MHLMIYGEFPGDPDGSEPILTPVPDELLLSEALPLRTLLLSDQLTANRPQPNQATLDQARQVVHATRARSGRRLGNFLGGLGAASFGLSAYLLTTALLGPLSPSTANPEQPHEAAGPNPAGSKPARVVIHYAALADAPLLDANLRPQVRLSAKEAVTYIGTASDGVMFDPNLPILDAGDLDFEPLPSDTMDNFTCPQPIEEVMGASPSPRVKPTTERLTEAMLNDPESQPGDLHVLVLNRSPEQKCGDDAEGRTLAYAGGREVTVLESTIWENGAGTGVLVHEFIHTVGRDGTKGYSHDNSLVCETDQATGAIQLDLGCTPYEYGNFTTSQGVGQEASILYDRDPFTGYQMLLNGLIDPSQIRTIDLVPGQTQATLESLASDTDGIKMLRIPLPAGTLLRASGEDAGEASFQPSAAYIELSSSYLTPDRKVGEPELKVLFVDERFIDPKYNYGEWAYTYAVDINEHGNKLGISTDDVGRVFTIQLGNMKIGLKISGVAHSDSTGMGNANVAVLINT